MTQNSGTEEKESGMLPDKRPHANGTSAHPHHQPESRIDEERLANRLQDKVTLIVGGASENGRSLAVTLAEKGSDVVILYFNDAHETAQEIQEQVEAAGRRCLAIRGNALDRQASEQLTQKIVEAFGRLDIFISFSAQLTRLKQPLAAQTPNGRLRVKIFPELCVMTTAVRQMLVNS
jgi:NAD(P)-dependent dehydrogenase (short-subunit alcohol dehydrogenase family)